MAQCFQPDGKLASSQFQCWDTPSDNEYSPCCVTGSYCYSNGWCLAANHMTVKKIAPTNRSFAKFTRYIELVAQTRAGTRLLVSKNAPEVRSSPRLWNHHPDILRPLAPIGGIYKCDDQGHAGCVIKDCGTSKQFSVSSGYLLLTGPDATKALSIGNYVSNTASGATQTSPAQTGSSSTESSSNSITASASSSIGQAAGAATESSPACSSSQAGISTGAAAGIGIGVGLPLLVALLASLFFLRSTRRKLAEAQHSRAAAPAYTDKPPVTDSKVNYDPWHPQQQELDGHSRVPAELSP